MKPIMINNSVVPKIIGWFSPIEPWAVTLWFLVFCRGVMSKTTENHESIHVYQFNDLLVLGFVIIYGWDYLHGCIKYRKDLSGTSPFGVPYRTLGEKAYFRTRAEQEAYSNDRNLNYLEERKPREWLTKYSV